MGYWLDRVFIVLVVAISAVYVIYALGSMSVKRRILAGFIHCFGLRIYTLLSPKIMGCTHCGVELQKKNLIRQLKQSGQADQNK